MYEIVFDPSDPFGNATLLTAATAAAGALLWKQHRIWGLALGVATGIVAYRVYVEISNRLQKPTVAAVIA